jgi:hypothetical protein
MPEVSVTRDKPWTAPAKCQVLHVSGSVPYIDGASVNKDLPTIIKQHGEIRTNDKCVIDYQEI